MRILRLIAALALVAAISAGCGDDDTSATTTTEAETAPSTSVGEDTPDTTEPDDGEPDTDTTNLSVYFLDDAHEIRVGYVRAVDARSPGNATLEELLAGPNADDEALGLSTAIPEGASLRSLNIAGGIATVDLSEEFAGDGDVASGQGRLAQVVYTLTQFPTVQQVELLVEGQPVDTLGDTGVPVVGTLTRADFEFDGVYDTLASAVLIETPRPGETIAGEEVTVGGSAFTFEAAVYLEVVDEDGEVIVPETYTMGNRGESIDSMKAEFSETLELPAGTTGEITIRAFDNSAEDGSRVGITEVPVTVAG